MVIIKFSYRQQFLAKNFQVKAVQDVRSDVGASWWVLQLYRVTVEASKKSGIVTGPCFFCLEKRDSWYANFFSLRSY